MSNYQENSRLLTFPPTLSDEEKITAIADHFRAILQTLGLDLNDPSLAKTPLRVAKMYVNEVFSGLKADTFPDITFVPNEYKENQMVFTKASFYSFCEHHFVPMNGIAYVAYIPNEKLIGLSKIPRLVRYFAKRPQLQERLTTQIADNLAQLMEADSVAVSIRAHHHCVAARGVEDSDSHTITNVLRGKFNSDAALRTQFFDAVNRR